MPGFAPDIVEIHKTPQRLQGTPILIAYLGLEGLIAIEEYRLGLIEALLRHPTCPHEAHRLGEQFMAFGKRLSANTEGLLEELLCRFWLIGG